MGFLGGPLGHPKLRKPFPEINQIGSADPMVGSVSNGEDPGVS